MNGLSLYDAIGLTILHLKSPCGSCTVLITDQFRSAKGNTSVHHLGYHKTASTIAVKEPSPAEARFGTHEF